MTEGKYSLGTENVIARAPLLMFLLLMPEADRWSIDGFLRLRAA